MGHQLWSGSSANPAFIGQFLSPAEADTANKTRQQKLTHRAWAGAMGLVRWVLLGAGACCAFLPPKCLLGALGRVIMTAQCNEKPGKTTQLGSALWEIKALSWPCGISTRQLFRKTSSGQRTRNKLMILLWTEHRNDKVLKMSQNHGIIKFGKDLQDHWIKPFPQHCQNHH